MFMNIVIFINYILSNFKIHSNNTHVYRCFDIPNIDYIIVEIQDPRILE